MLMLSGRLNLEVMLEMVMDILSWTLIKVQP